MKNKRMNNFEKMFLMLSSILLSTLICGMYVYAGTDYDILDVQITATVDYDLAMSAIESCNELRFEYGQQKLSVDPELMQYAEQRAYDLCVLFSHKLPQTGTCRKYSTRIYGENIGSGDASALSIKKSIEASAAHRNTLLNPENVSTGFAFIRCNGQSFWVQLFAKDQADGRFSETGSITKRGTVSVCKGSIGFAREHNNVKSAYELPYGTVDHAETVFYNYWEPKVSVAIVEDDIIQYYSSDMNIFTVDHTGAITPVSVGSAKLWMYLKEDEQYSKDNSDLVFSQEIVVKAWDINQAERVRRSYINNKQMTESLYSRFYLEDQIYTGNAIEPLLEVKDCFGNRMLKDRDYVLTYQDNKEAGLARMDIAGCGNYCGNISAYYRIVREDKTGDSTGGEDHPDEGNETKIQETESHILTAHWENQSEYFYDGTQIMPKPNVADENRVLLTENRDYGLSYRNNLNPGTATCIVYGIGEYAGAKIITIDFQIVRQENEKPSTGSNGTTVISENSLDKKNEIITEPILSKKIKNLKKVKIKYLKSSKKKMLTIKIQRVNDASGYEVQYSLSKKFSQSKTKSIKVRTTTAKIKKLKSKKKYYIRVRAFILKNGSYHYAAWCKSKVIKIK